MTNTPLFCRPDYKLNFYYKDGGSEIDFILDGQIAMEVKTSASGRDIAHLKIRAEILKLARYFVVSYEYNTRKEVVLATDF